MTEETFKIRRASLRDLSGVISCVDLAYTPYLNSIGVRPGPMDDDYSKLIEDSHVWVAVSEMEQVVGVLVMYFKTHAVLMDNAAVVPEWQNRYVLRAFSDLAKREGRARGISKLELYTNAKMTRNIELYKRRGWTVTDRRFEDGFDRVYMQRAVKENEGWE